MTYTLTNGRVEEILERLRLEKTYSREGGRSRNENGWRNWGLYEDRVTDGR